MLMGMLVRMDVLPVHITRSVIMISPTTRSPTIYHELAKFRNSVKNVNASGIDNLPEILMIFFFVAIISIGVRVSRHCAKKRYFSFLVGTRYFL